MPSVISETWNFVTEITLNLPEKGNVVNNDNLSLLSDLLDKAVSSPETRVIVLRGRDGVFCRGMDFKNLIQNAADLSDDFSQPYLDAVLKLRNSPKPVIAAVDGDVLAGGMGLALACDIIIATDRSVFGLSEVLFGLIPAYVFPFLLERLSFKKARSLVLSSNRFSAAEALSLGMVDEVTTEERFPKKLTEYYKRLLYSSPDALKTLKSYSDKFAAFEIREALQTAREQLHVLLRDESNINAIKSFLDGEKLKWSVKYKRKKQG